VKAIETAKNHKFERHNIYYKKDCSINIAKEINNFLNTR